MIGITNNGDWTITGIKQSGKGRICKEFFIPMYKRDHRKVAICDPIMDQWPGADYVTNDVGRFIDVMQRSKNVMGFVDEMNLIRKNREHPEWIIDLQKFAGISRHYGHIMHYMGQRVMHIPPDIRELCDNAVVLRQKMKGLVELDEQLDTNGAVFQAAQFQRGIALIVQPFEKPVKVRVF